MRLGHRVERVERRNGRWIVRASEDEVGTDAVVGMLLARFPSRAADRVAAVARRVAIGDLRGYGLAPARQFEARRPPLIDGGVLDDRGLSLARRDG